MVPPMTRAIRHTFNKSTAFIPGVCAVLPTFGGLILLAAIVTAFVGLRDTVHKRMFPAAPNSSIYLSLPIMAAVQWPAAVKSVHEAFQQEKSAPPPEAAKPRYRLVYPLQQDRYRLVEIKAFALPPASETRMAKRRYSGSEKLIAAHLARKKHHIYHPIIHEAANRHEVDPALVKAIIMAESGYDPKAISKRGAKGLMQLMPSTAKALGVEDVFNPEHNINGGVRYFKRLVNRFNGDVRLALAAYNAGSRKVKQYQGIPPFKATRFYIKKVLTYYEYFKQRSARDLNSA